MAKFSGMIGFAIQEETRPGVWTETVREQHYYGDVQRNSRRLQTSGNLNDDIEISNRISIVADPFAWQNFHNMRYVNYMGSRWKVSDAEVEFPRLILTLGGLYNG